MVHRGEAAQAPENSRPALLRCIEDGFEWAEVDVRLTSDRRHVLSHADQISDGQSAPLKIAEHSLAELKAVDIGAPFAVKYDGEHLLTLEECFALAKGKLNLYLDCKAADPVQLAREIAAAGMEHQTVVYDSLANLHRVEGAAPGRIALMAKWHPADGLESWVRSNHLAAVEMNAEEVTASAVRSFHDLSVKVQVKVLDSWDRVEFWDKAIAAKADWLQTDLPEELIAHALQERIQPHPVLFSLHRGAKRYAPENTVPAFAKAIRLGADFVEFDVRTTSDGKYYLLHDSKLDGKTNGKGPISSTPSSVIDTLSAGVKFGRPFANVRMPTLDEFLTAVEGKVNLYFDAKAIPPEALAEAVDRHHMAERTVVYQSAPYLARLRAIDPRIRTLAPLGSASELPALAEKLKPYAVDADWDILSRELIARCHSLGVLVYSDALGRHERVEDYLQAMDWGIDLIQTDHPMKLWRALELRSAALARK